jgi:hypothetical protein
VGLDVVLWRDGFENRRKSNGNSVCSTSSTLADGFGVAWITVTRVARPALRRWNRTPVRRSASAGTSSAWLTIGADQPTLNPRSAAATIPRSPSIRYSVSADRADVLADVLPDAKATSTTLGAGLNYTLFYNNGLHAGDTPVSIKNSSIGPALQAGIDVQVARNLFVNADIKKIWMRTSASADGASLGSLKIDPLVVGIGVGMRF